ncbi:Crp/Fnr family transcriptional regulator [Alkalilimnicola sp. S0819]|uniref:Crp/Fnr family transcriptional regulator n=1 Tax=Alkalilimnicola sp. S0819 TaxID=2613922 RepID=UPI0012621CDD|nr:Crp/Fnr family transcriptional regulator [Alkalilimnicola sp. S0819]KAB7627783.1 Crp/Fnr family transcriptional regulator [Alkalilimnicola sp. S0819]MPQ15411.1 cyclic nucleotide-binding domain-containing protein [Alkalilimnicola sp. S0819]
MNATADETRAVAEQLRRTPPFTRLADSTLGALGRSAQTLHLRPGQFLAQAGETPRGVAILTAGTLKLAFPSATGQEKVLELLLPGRSFGQAELFANQPFPYYVEALEPSNLILIPAAAVQQWVQEDGEFARAMLTCLGRQFHALARDVESLAGHSALVRVLRFLVNRVAEVAEGEATVSLLARKGVLASRLGLTPETLSRTLRELQERGLLGVRGDHLTVHDVAALRALLEQQLWGG